MTRGLGKYARAETTSNTNSFLSDAVDGRVGGISDGRLIHYKSISTDLEVDKYQANYVFHALARRRRELTEHLDALP